MVDRSPKGRGSKRGAVIAAASGACVAAAGILGTLVVQRIGDEAADETVAEVDARRLAVEVELPGSSCDYTAATGWGDPSDAMDHTGILAVEKAVRKTQRLGDYGPARLHFTLPKTADKAVIDVRRIDIRSTATRTAPSWSISQEGCGGGQYSRTYVALLRASDTEVFLVDDDSLIRGSTFEPFSVTSGENVFMDYELAMCEPVTLDVQFDVTYKPDSAPERTISVPDKPIRMSGMRPLTEYVSSEGELQEVSPSAPVLSPSCEAP